MLPADKTLVHDLMDTYKGEGEFVDFCYGRMREMRSFNPYIYIYIYFDGLVFLMY